MKSPTHPTRILLLCTLPGALYFAAFLVVFEPLSSPCRTRERWLGPRLRFDSSYVEIGKSSEYRKGGSAAYSAFGPLCGLWLSAHGL